MAGRYRAIVRAAGRWLSEADYRFGPARRIGVGDGARRDQGVGRPRDQRQGQAEGRARGADAGAAAIAASARLTGTTSWPQRSARSVTARLAEPTLEVCDRALREALALGHNYIQPEHLLLTLIRQEDSVTVRALAELDIEPIALRRAVLKVLGDGLRQDQAQLRTEIRTDLRIASKETP